MKGHQCQQPFSCWMAEFSDIFDSPIGKIRIKATDKGVSFCDFWEGDIEDKVAIPNVFTIQAMEWLDAFFSNQTLPPIELDLTGTDFQIKVWQEISKVSYGETITYNEIALVIPGSSARAVGTATGANPVSIIVPCHRVVGSDGKLHGYSGGIKRKIWLLAFEKGDSLFLPDV